MALVLAACGRADSPPQERPALRAAPAPTPSPEAGEYAVAGHNVRLVVEEDACFLGDQTEGGPPTKLKLDLGPPCYLLTWQQRPPRFGHPEGISDGVPVGDVGDVKAWRYGSAQGATTIAVIGDPVPESMRSDRYLREQREGFRCAASVQGVLLLGPKVWLSKKHDRVGPICVEIGIDQKVFWMLAHD